MPNNFVYTTDHAIYDIKPILEEFDIDPKEMYMFKSTSGEQESGALIFLLNGQEVIISGMPMHKAIMKEIPVQGKDLHRLTFKANTVHRKGIVDPGENRGDFPFEEPSDFHEDVPRVEYIPYNKINITVKGVISGKSYSFTVITHEVSDDAYKKDQPPTIEAKGTLALGNNKVTDLVGYKDTDGKVNSVRLDVEPGPSQTKEASLIFDGENIGNKGKFQFTPSQLPQLEIHVPSKPTCDDVIKVRSFDMQRKGSYPSVSLTSGS